MNVLNDFISGLIDNVDKLDIVHNYAANSTRDHVFNVVIGNNDLYLSISLDFKTCFGYVLLDKDKKNSITLGFNSAEHPRVLLLGEKLLSRYEIKLKGMFEHIIKSL